MRYRILIPLLALSLNAVAEKQNIDLPSCDVQGQHAVVGETGGPVSDLGQAHISVRANILIADIGTLRKARNITQAEADRMFKRVEAIRNETDRFVSHQGFLSAGEKASFDRELDGIATQLCK